MCTRRLHRLHHPLGCSPVATWAELRGHLPGRMWHLSPHPEHRDLGERQLRGIVQARFRSVHSVHPRLPTSRLTQAPGHPANTAVGAVIGFGNLNGAVSSNSMSRRGCVRTMLAETAAADHVVCCRSAQSIASGTRLDSCSGTPSFLATSASASPALCSSCSCSGARTMPASAERCVASTPLTT
jgi:hypothetical protein